MRWVTYASPSGGVDRAGLLVDGEVRGVAASLLELLQTDQLAAAAIRAATSPTEVLALSEVVLRGPIPEPPSIRDFMAFEEHVVTSTEALGGTVDPVWYEQPVFYFTNPAAVLGPEADVPVAPGSSAWDYELEVAAVIGKGGSNLDPGEAEAHIAGFLILCDWSARDLQGTEMRMLLGPVKGKDTATTFGPVMVTPDELEPYRSGKGYALTMRAWVNGKQYSSGTWSTIYWSFPQMLAYASRGTTLRVGDVIGSGTVGTGCILELSRVHGLDDYPWLVPGDVVRLEVDQLGSTTSRIVEGGTPIPLSHHLS